MVTGSNLQLINDTIQVLQNNFKIKDLGSVRYLLGIDFARNSDQRKYALEIILDLGLASSKHVATLVEMNVKLTDALLPDIDDDLRVVEYIKQSPAGSGIFWTAQPHALLGFLS